MTTPLATLLGEYWISVVAETSGGFGESVQNSTRKCKSTWQLE